MSHREPRLLVKVRQCVWARLGMRLLGPRGRANGRLDVPRQLAVRPQIVSANNNIQADLPPGDRRRKV
jgi:hypothetical protein